MIIQHNLKALNATRNLNTTVGKKANSTEKLSSGYKVNNGADNAAAMAISENMRRRIRGMQQASFNTKDGISFAQSAEGALNEVHDLLQRANELAVKAANDTNQPADRKAIYDEIAQLHKEINRIATSMQFNEIDMFDSSHVPSEEKNNAGASVTQTADVSDIIFMGADYVSFEMQDFSESISQAQAAGKTFTQDGLSGFAEKIRDEYMPKLLGNTVSALPQSAVPTVSGMQIGLKMYYGDDSTLAYVSSNGISFQLGINLKYLNESGGNIGMSDDLATTIAHEMTHAVMFDATTNGMLGVHGADQFPAWFVEGTAQAVGGAINYCSELVNNAMPQGDGAIGNWLSKLTDVSDSYNAYAQGYIASMYLGYMAGGGQNVDAKTIASGLDNIIKDIEDGYSLGQAVSRQTNGKYYDLADFEDNFSKDAVKFTKDLVTAIGNGTGSIASPDGLSGSKNSLLKGNAGSKYFELDVDHQSVENNLGGKNTYTGGGATTTGGLNRDGNMNTDAEGTWGSSSDAKRGTVQRSGILSVQVGAEAHQMIELSTFMLSTNDLGIADVKVDSMENAGRAIDKYKTAINCVSIMRSEYGAVQNRLEHTILNLDNMVEKMQSAESLIRDTDVADEMVEYSINNILEQSGVSILAQANQSAQNAMRLLQ